MKILIRNGHVVDPLCGRDEDLDLLIEKGRVVSVAKGLSLSADRIIEAQGRIVMPGVFDMHAHLREPGREDKETVATGSRAALKGGVTSVLAMPNTTPVIDDVRAVELLKDIIHRSSCANVFIASTITRARQGQEVVDVPALKKAGVVAMSDDGSSVDNEEVMREALSAAGKAGLPVICHCEDTELSACGVVNMGFISTCMGLKGISRESEYKRVQRDIRLARQTGARIHIAHVSCRESVEMIAKAKAEGVAVSAETAPHYVALSEEAVLDFDTCMKMNPPLRSSEDVKVLKEALRDGVIDVVASDHAPHTENEKEIEFDRAEFGVTGLETLLSVCVTELVDKGILTWSQLVEKLSVNPAKVLNVKKGSLKEGADADVIVVDPSKEWTVARDGFVSLSKNSCFLGRALKGVVEVVICGGEVM